ncbi:AAA family ATPase [uncultured Methanosphaera sp.]|uniref:AAA family ATPase n=1 Tax=uncultured Methanosphaera sp. TaxID=262501 RepID=UPI000DC5E6DD|nr:AAA family ATPase [uncultured Methanosphaera sp.]RAP43675.1 MAG: hypothetical protein BZ134_05980 [Methanosphaera sp. SHI1033]
MIINNIRLENFRSHKNTEIDFNQGISLILGENGAGKSSILEAISYTLFKDTNSKIDDLIRKPQDDNDVIDKMLVTIEFKHNGITYQIKRGKRKSTSIAELRYEEKDNFVLKCKGDRNVTKDIENILEMDSKSFLNAIYIRQGEITDLIEKTASERKEFITKLLNIDALEKAWDEIKKIISIYEEQKNINEGKLSRYDEITKDKEELTENIIENQTRIAKNKNQKEILGKKLEELEIQVKEIEDTKNKYEKLNNNLTEKINSITQLNRIKDNYEQDLENIIKSEKEIRELEKEIKPLPQLKELKDLKQDIVSYKKDLEQIEQNIKKIKENQQTIQDTQEDYTKYCQLEEEKETITKQLEELRKKDNENTSITSKIESKDEEKTRLTNEIGNTSNYAYSLFNERSTDPEEIQEKTRNEKTKTDNSIDIIERSITKNKEQLSSFQTSLRNTKKSLEELEKTEDKCPICQSNIPHEKHMELSQKYNNDIVSYELRIEELEEANKNQEKKLLELKEYEKQLDKINIPLLKDQYENFKKIDKEIKELKTQIPFIEKIKNELTIKNKELEETKSQLNSLKENYEKHQFALNLVNKLPSLDEETKKQEETNIQYKDLINKSRQIMTKVHAGDDLNRRIKYLEKQENICNQLRGKVQDKDNKIKQKEEITKQINNENYTLNNIKQELSYLSFSQEKYDLINNKYRSCDENIKEYTQIIIQESTSLTKDQEQEKKYSEELEELDKIKKEQEYITDYIKLLNEIRDTYSKDGVQRDLRSAVRPQIEKNTMDIFAEFGFNYSEINLDEDYNMTVKTKNEILDLNMLSGGEKIVMALALRLGIAKVISQNKTELLILDEPTIHLDAERRRDLIEIIRSINIVPQMLVVTHDDEMEALSNNIIKISKINGISNCEIN